MQGIRRDNRAIASEFQHLPSRSRLLLLVAVILSPCMSHAQLPAGTTDATQSRPATQDPLRTQANAALSQHDYPTALKLLTTLAERDPADAHLLYDLASVQDALAEAPAQAATAEATYRRAIAADPRLFEAHLAFALLLARQHETSQAEAELTAAIALDTPDTALKARAYRTLARLNQPSNPGAASANLLAALKLSPETPEDIILGAEIAEAADDLPAAEAAYRRLLATSPADPAATAALTHLLLRQNKPAEAETLLTAALAAHPGDTTLNAQLATVYLADPDPAKAALAQPLVEQLHASHPNDPAVTRLLARLYSRNAQYDKAEPLFAALLTSAPKPDPTLLDDQADVLIHLKRPAEAEALLKRALANSAAFPSKEDLGMAASHLAFAASENNDPAVTLQALSIRATLLPQSPSALFLAATAHDKLHEVKQASELYKQFIDLANGKFPDEEWQARHRLITLAHQK